MTSSTVSVKILVMGDVGVGKTSIVRTWCQNSSFTATQASVAVEFQTKIVDWGRRKVHVSIWDIAGQERTKNITRPYFQGAHGAFVVYDKTRKETFDATESWKREIEEKVTLPNGQPLPVLLLGNKCDLPPCDTSAPDPDLAYLAEKKYIGFHSTSALQPPTIDKAIMNLLRHVFDALPDGPPAPPLKFIPIKDVAPPPHQEQSSSCC